MRSAALVAVPLLLLAGCGGAQSRSNELRPPSPAMLTAAIREDGVLVSPTRVGAGTVVLVVSNQSRAPQTVTFETDEVGSSTGGTTASSPEIAPRATGRLTISAREGTYSVHTADDAIRAASVRIGPPRKSSQDALLLP